jgi:hypothetical protein
MPINREKGQAIILVLVGLAGFVAASIGLAIDASHLYAQRQMAQAAADGAAQAAIYSIYTKTNTAAYSNAFTGSDFTCSTSTANWTPCNYALKSGFGGSGSDTVSVSFPSSAPGVTLDPSFSPNLVKVRIVRTVSTTLIRFVGPPTATVSAEAMAGIVKVDSPVPIIVLHPNLPQSYSRQGASTIQICGGPDRSIQVNSSDANAVNDGGGGTVDLSKAGPDASSPTSCDGTGADFGALGGPSSYPGTLLLGTNGKYRQPAGPIYDPFASVPTPPVPLPALTTKLPVPAGVDGCPAGSKNPCFLYLPGRYDGGITVSGETALFMPGLYYMNGGGFHGAGGNSAMLMAACPAPAQPTLTPPLPAIVPLTDFGCGMMVYNTGNGNKDFFEVGANGNATLLGSLDGGTYKGILFFEDHNALAQTHRLGGGGNLSLTGTIYLTDTQQTSTVYQSLSLRGNSGNTTQIIGEIVVDVLSLGGTGGVSMFLDPTKKLPIPKMALVQ